MAARNLRQNAKSRRDASDDPVVVLDPSPSEGLRESYPASPVVSCPDPDHVKVLSGRYLVNGKFVFIPEDTLVRHPYSKKNRVKFPGRDMAVLLGSDAAIKLAVFDPRIDMASAIRDGVEVSGIRYRVLGGVHLLCEGTASLDQSHPLFGLVAGSMLPASAWALNFRPACPDPRAMAYVKETDVWVDIYNASGDIAAPESRFGGIRLAARSQTELSTGLGNVGKLLPTDADFLSAALGSNAGTTVMQNPNFGARFALYRNSQYNAFRPPEDGEYYRNERNVYYADLKNDTTGGHVDTRYRRMVSDIGCEEMCGLQRQFLRTVRPDVSKNVYRTVEKSVQYLEWDFAGICSFGSNAVEIDPMWFQDVTAFNISAACAGGGACDMQAACGPASRSGTSAVSPGPSDRPSSYSTYPLASLVGDEPPYTFKFYRDDILSGENHLTEGPNPDAIFAPYYTGSRGASPCIHISLVHHEVPSGILPDFMWFRNVWTEPLVLNFENTGYGSIRAVLEFSRLSGSMSWNQYEGAPEADRVFNPGETMCVRAPVGVVNNAFGRRFRPLSLGSYSYDDRWKRVTGAVEVGGNIMSVLEHGATEFPDYTTHYAFRDAFSQCPSLLSSRKLVLPAKVAVSGCYCQMFGDMNDRPYLPWTKYMVDAPEIRAMRLRASTTSSSRIYSPFEWMFAGCTAMVDPPPELLMESAQYEEMFRQCSSMRRPPRITAEDFSEDSACYRMFRGCTSMKTVSVLHPVGPVGPYAMYQMFGNGSSASGTGIRYSTEKGGDYQYEWSLPELGSGSDGDNALTGMLNGTAAVRGQKYYFTEPPVE